VIKDFNQKLLRLRVPRGYSIEKIIITKNGISKSLSTSGYFDHTFEIDEIFS
jgi:hypothetical protein